MLCIHRLRFGLVEIEFLLPPIMSVASESSSGIAIADGVDGNAVRKEVIGVQASESFLPMPESSMVMVELARRE